MISFAPQYPQFPMYDEEREGNVRPVTQTIKTDPVTGEQTMTISGSPTDLGAGNPFTPTVIEPGQPGQATIQPVQVAGPVQPGMMAQSQESEAERRARAQAAAQAAMPTQPAAVQPAVTAMPSMAQAQAQPQTKPMGVPQGASAVTQTAQTFRQPLAEPAGWMTDVVRLQTNPAGLAAYYGNEANDAQGRNLARSLLLQNFEDQQRQQQAQQKVDQAITSGNMLDIAREAQKSGEEGSYIKAYLYQRLGLTKLAQDEQEKLSPTTRWERVMTQDNKPALVKVDRRGMPIEGYSQEGRLTDQQLIGINAGKQLDIVGGTYVNDRTGQVGRVVTDKKTGQSYIQTDTGAVPMTGFRPQSSTGTMDMQRAQQVQRQNIELAGDWVRAQTRVQSAGPQAANQVLGEFNAKYGTNFSLQQLAGSAPQISLETGMMTQGGQPVQMAPQPVAPPAGAAPAAVSPAMVQPTPAAPAAPAQPAVVPQPSVPVRPQISAPVTQPAAPGAGAITPAQVQGAATTMPPVFTPSPIQPGETPGTYAERVRREGEAYASALRQSEARQQAALNVGVSQQQAAITNQQLEERRRQESLEANRKTLPGAELQARNVLKTVDDVLSHPGFASVVGVKDITGLIQKLPATDARDFTAKYNQLKGQQFLQAYESLKGGGAISEIEGAKAEQAVAALQDPGISQAEFRRNAQILKEVIQNGVDLARMRANFEPKYRPFNDRERTAWRFVLANPNDQRSAEIRNRLENR